MLGSLSGWGLVEVGLGTGRSGSGSLQRARIIMIASWLLTTSQSPSVARMSRWSSLLSSSSKMSGSATTYRFSSRSPNARDTAGTV